MDFASLRNKPIVFLFLVAILAYTTIAHADVPDKVEAKKLSDWYCQNLISPFDFERSAKTFPFEKLTLEAETPPKLNSDSTASSVDRRAKGENYTIEYHYQYNMSNVSEPYGFSLSVDRKISPGVDPMEFARTWLAGFGKAKYEPVGYMVGFGPSQFPGLPPAAQFGYWSTGRIIAQWFSVDGIQHFKTACTKKESPANAKRSL